MDKRIIRVFPRRTKATPDDPLAVVNRTPELFDEADEVHVSVVFKWDLPTAEKLARAWAPVAPVKIGGPATGERGEAFIPGRYVKHGLVITSRGCPNRCWFCSVWRRDGNIRELPILDGWDVLDDNLLACSYAHVIRVFAMLGRMKAAGHRVQFSGGIEARRLQAWHVEYLRELKPKQMFFAYDTPDDYEPLRAAAELLLSAGFTAESHALRCYVLVGFPQDTISAAHARLTATAQLGFTPMAMRWRNEAGDKACGPEWIRLQKEWARPAIIHAVHLLPKLSA